MGYPCIVSIAVSPIGLNESKLCLIYSFIETSIQINLLSSYPVELNSFTLFPN